jgi:uncharacterized protein YbaA (DUF1428 family)
MAYVDGFVLPVPKKNLAVYRKMAGKAAKTWMKHGALSYVVTVADDVKPGKVTSFPQSVKLKDGETVIFAWVTYKSRKHRDQVMVKAMNDPAMSNYYDLKTLPFDGRRMFWGGFKELVAM